MVSAACALVALGGCQDEPRRKCFTGWCTSGDDIADDEPQDAPVSVTCDVVTSRSCNANEKCEWVIDAVQPPFGHRSCVPDGTVELGAACQRGTAGPAGYSDCQRGGFCDDTGVCVAFCTTAGPACPDPQSCTVDPGAFDGEIGLCR